MQFEIDNIYHIYTQGNNQQKIFYSQENYLFFLRKIRTHIHPFTEILAYCLMPNHFHLLIVANEKTVLTKEVAKKQKNILSENIRIMLSSYTQAINKQEGFSGSLFRQNIKIKKLNKDEFLISTQKQFYHNDILTCLNYIHQNPVQADLVEKPEHWGFSSFQDYIGKRNGTLCNKELTFQLADIDVNTILQQSNINFNDEQLSKIL